MTRIDQQFTWSLFARLLRSPALLSQAESLIQPTHFLRPAEDYLLVLWTAIRELRVSGDAVTYNNLRDRAQLLLARQALPEGAVAMLFAEPTQIGQSAGLLYWAFHATLTDGDDTSREMLRLFLLERDVRQRLTRDVAGAASGDVLQQALLRASQSLGRLSAVGSNPTQGVLSGDWEGMSFLECESTGDPIFDAVMGGGYVSGEMYALLGPSGAGKTRTAVHLACAKSVMESAAAAAAGRRPRSVYLATYEMSRLEIEQLVVQKMAQIPHDRLQSIRHMDALSTATNPESYREYERQRFATAFDAWARGAGPPPGERERYQAAAATMRCLRIINLSGRDDGRKGSSLTGGGMVPELQACVELDQEENKSPGVAMVMADFVGLAARRHIGVTNQREDALRHLIAQYLDQFRTRIVGQTTGTVGWIMSQVNTSAQRASPTKKLSHYDAEEAPGAFGQLMSFCFALSTKDTSSGCVQMAVSKTRRAESQPSIIWSHERMSYGELVNVTDKYEINTHAGVFEKKSISPRAASTPTRPKPANIPVVQC